MCRTAARVVRGLSRSHYTSPKSLMDADIVRFLLCLLEEGDEPATEQEVRQHEVVRWSMLMGK